MGGSACFNLTLNNLIFYEFPLCERIRVFMRLEQLFQQIDHFSQGNTVWDSRAVVYTLLDILTIFSRNDLKSEILKELDRHSGVLTRISHSQSVDMERLRSIMSELDSISKQLYSTNGKIGLRLLESELFKSISQRSSIPGGSCAFDLPEYHFWLQQATEQRKQDMEVWLRPFSVIRQATDLILRFIRQSATPDAEIAQAGFFQQTLDRTLPYQLIRVGVNEKAAYFAEISGGKHRFTVRFMTADISARPTQTDQDISFSLVQCIF